MSKKVRFTKNGAPIGFAYIVNDTAVLSDNDAKTVVDKGFGIEISMDKDDKEEVKVKKAPTKVGTKKVEKR